MCSDHTQGNDVKKAAVHGGIIEILKDKVTILAEVAEWSDEIDVKELTMRDTS